MRIIYYQNIDNSFNHSRVSREGRSLTKIANILANILYYISYKSNFLIIIFYNEVQLTLTENSRIIWHVKFYVKLEHFTCENDHFTCES